MVTQLVSEQSVRLVEAEGAGPRGSVFWDNILLAAQGGRCLLSCSQHTAAPSLLRSAFCGGAGFGSPCTCSRGNATCCFQGCRVLGFAAGLFVWTAALCQAIRAVHAPNKVILGSAVSVENGSSWPWSSVRAVHGVMASLWSWEALCLRVSADGNGSARRCRGRSGFFLFVVSCWDLAEGKQLVLAAKEPNIWRVTAGYRVKPKDSRTARRQEGAERQHCVLLLGHLPDVRVRVSL